MTHSENGTGNRSEIRELSSTPKACNGKWERASSIIHAAGVRFAFPSSAPGALGVGCEGLGSLPDRHDPLKFVAEILKVLRADAHVEHFFNHGKEINRQPNGGDFAKVAGSWLKWQLKGDLTAAKMFVGSSCGLCADPKWTIERKMLPN